MNATTAANLLTYLSALGIRLVANGDRVRFHPKSAMTPELTEQVKVLKPELLTLLAAGDPQEGAPPAVYETSQEPMRNEGCVDVDAILQPRSTVGENEAASWEDCVEPPDPCPKCGSLMIWWDVLGGQHCMICEEPKYSAEKAEELREMAKQPRQFPRRASFLREGR